jgi:DNA methylase
LEENVTGGDHREFAMASGEMTDAEFLVFNEAWMAAVLPYPCDGGVCGSFIDWRGLPTLHSAASKLGLVPLNLIVWAKTNASMGSLHRSQQEWLRSARSTTSNSVNVADGARTSGRILALLRSAPTPVAASRNIRLSSRPPCSRTRSSDLTNRGDIVIDPFLGSGSTLIAAKAAGRGVELDPLYVDVIVRRYEAATGHPAARPSRRWAGSAHSRRRAARARGGRAGIRRPTAALRRDCNPDLPVGFAFGKHIVWREMRDPTLAARTHCILAYAQFWTWKMCGARVSEVSSPGCHKHFWSPVRDAFSSLAVVRAFGDHMDKTGKAGPKSERIWLLGAKFLSGQSRICHEIRRRTVTNAGVVV